MTAVAEAPATTALALTAEMTTTVYSKPACVQCNATYRAFDKHGIDYDKVDMSQDLDALDRVRAYGYMQAPVVMVADADGIVLAHWSGFRPDAVESLAAGFVPELAQAAA